MDEKQTIALECCKLQCFECNAKVPLVEYPDDLNLYHTNGTPCKAYRIRRYFSLQHAA